MVMYEKVAMYYSHKTVVVVDEVSQNRNANSTTIRVRAHFVPFSRQGTLEQWSNQRRPGSTTPTKYTLSVDGVDYVRNIPDGNAYAHHDYWIQQNPTGLLIDKTLTFVHDAQGNRSIPITLISNGTNFYHDSIAETYRITSIAQTSTATISGNMIGNPVNIAITRSTEALTHKIYWSFGTLSGTISTNATTSATWTPSLAQLAPTMPNLSSGKATIRVESYVNGAKSDERTYEHILHLPGSVKPSLTGITLIDGNQKASGLNLGANTFVQSQSNIRPRFDGANGIYGSQIVSYRAEIHRWVNNQWQQTGLYTTANNGLTGNATFTGRAKVVAYVTDSRGRQSDRREVEINYLPYHVPALSFVGDRTGASDDKINVTRTIRIAPLTVNNMQKNTGRLTFDVVDIQTNQRTNNIGGSADWVGTTEHEKLNWLATLNGTYDAGKSYLVIGKLSDAFHTVTFEYRVGVQAVPASISKFGLAVGKEWSRGVLDVGGSDHLPAYFDCDIYVREKPIQLHQLTDKDGRSPYNGGGTVDLNTKTINSFFSCNEPQNGPTVIGSNQFYIAVYSESDNYLSQMAIQKNGGNVYTRTRHAGTWQPWKQLATTDMIGAQKHKLSEDNGIAIHVTGDWNNVTTTGFYRGSGLANQPSKAGAHSWYYVRVTGHDAGRTWVLQEAIDFNGVGSWYRVKLNNVWQPWKQYAMEKPAPMWVSTGVAGCDYKVDGGVVSLRLNHTSNLTLYASGNYSLGSIPSNLVPVSGTDSIFKVRVFSSVSNSDADIRIASTGAITFVGINYGTYKLATQITWQI
ncbi:TPA: DUF859 family phage minor structural protein [Streptococcus suis]